MNKRIKKKKKPDLQTAWNVVAEALNKDGEICYFIDRDNTSKEWDIHSAAGKNILVVSNIKEGK